MVQTGSLKTSLLQAECWVFDLDNTLYPASSNIFTQVDEKMTRFIADFLDLNLEQAGKLRKAYYLEHGTTLSGLMKRHGLDPDHFLDFVHDIDLSTVLPDLGLDRALSRLPGRKIIFTNGPTDHAERVLDRLSIRHHFEAIFDIIGADYIPKPMPGPYDVLVDRYRLKPEETVMVEDLVRNLKPAAALGMTTVWVRSDSDLNDNEPVQDDIHHVVDDLTHWLGALASQ